MADVAVGLLGPVEMQADGRTAPVADVELQSLLAVLALAFPHGVSVDRLLEELWGEYGSGRIATTPRSPLGQRSTAVRCAGSPPVHVLPGCQQAIACILATFRAGRRALEVGGTPAMRRHPGSAGLKALFGSHGGLR